MGVIVSARLETGLLNTRTPTFDFKAGWCDFCKSGNDGSPRCIEVCPTQALNLPAGADPEKSIIGIAYIVKDWCLGWQLKGCKTCYNECPFDAISLDYAERPLIDATLCNGCGRCEEVCPSAQATSYTVGATDRAVTIKPVEVFEQLMTASGEATLEAAGERGLL
jgi:ferredoxin-type protein NapG